MAEERKQDPAKAAENRQRIYAVQRLPLIKQELDKLKTERVKLREEVQSSAGKTDKTALVNLRKKRIYNSVRIGVLMQEQKSLAEGRRELKARRKKESA